MGTTSDGNIITHTQQEWRQTFIDTPQGKVRIKKDGTPWAKPGEKKRQREADGMEAASIEGVIKAMGALAMDPEAKRSERVQAGKAYVDLHNRNQEKLNQADIPQELELFILTVKEERVKAAQSGKVNSVR